MGLTLFLRLDDLLHQSVCLRVGFCDGPDRIEIKTEHAPGAVCGKENQVLAAVGRKIRHSQC